MNERLVIMRQQILAGEHKKFRQNDVTIDTKNGFEGLSWNR